jgi:mono/diheme cytochrome c family protein
MKHSKILCAALLSASAAAAFGQAVTAPAAAGGGKPPYTVVDGNKVDPNTLQGFKTWRSAACDRCHGANQEGLVGPSLVNSLKTLTKEEFVKVVANGRPNTQMIAFSGNAEVMKNMDQLYAYLKGRSDGAITKARVEAMP